MSTELQPSLVSMIQEAVRAMPTGQKSGRRGKSDYGDDNDDDSDDPGDENENVRSSKSSSSSSSSSSTQSSLLSELRRSLRGDKSTQIKSSRVSFKQDGGSGDDDDDDSSDASSNDKVAAAILENARKYGSLLTWIRMTTMKQARNRHECEALADAIDTLLEEGVSESSLGIEKLLRRLSGVHLADSVGNWNVCEALQWSGVNHSLLPRDALTSALKQAASYQSLTRKLMGRTSGNRQRPSYDSSSSSSSAYSGSFRSRGRGQGNYRSFNKASAVAAAAQSGTSDAVGGAQRS